MQPPHLEGSSLNAAQRDRKEEDGTEAETTKHFNHTGVNTLLPRLKQEVHEEDRTHSHALDEAIVAFYPPERIFRDTLLK